MNAAFEKWSDENRCRENTGIRWKGCHSCYSCCSCCYCCWCPLGMLTVPGWQASKGSKVVSNHVTMFVCFMHACVCVGWQFFCMVLSHIGNQNYLNSAVSVVFIIICTFVSERAWVHTCMRAWVHTCVRAWERVLIPVCCSVHACTYTHTCLCLAWPSSIVFLFYCPYHYCIFACLQNALVVTLHWTPCIHFACFSICSWHHQGFNPSSLVRRCACMPFLSDI